MDNDNQVLQRGMLLDGNKYRIEAVLGQGGFGITYLATDMSLDRRVAIKEFFPSTFCFRDGTTSHVTLGTQSSRGFVERLKAKFLKEARNIAKFDHPGIIKIHAAFEDNNTAYYVMEYIEGQSLSEIVKRSGPLTEAQAVKIIGQVGSALEYIHARRINHLDVKPANIMVRYSGEPVLIDFGLSKQYDNAGNQTSTTPVGLSHGYAPMEQYKDGGVREFTPATDIYSLAATLYYILSGIVPPQAPDLVEEELPIPTAIPHRLIAPIRKAMSSARRLRHASVTDFVRDLTAGYRAATDDNEETVMIKKPKAQPKAGINTGHTPYRPTPAPKPANAAKIAVISIVAALLTVAVGLTIWLGASSIKAEAKSSPTMVTDMKWESPLGPAAYTGEVMPDSVEGSEKMLPDGKGVARITAGKYKGCIYDGEFSKGRMHGQATYTRPNGDTFVGTFLNNEYDNGRYTDRDSGEYFEGTFKNSQPDQGTWYDRNGKAL